VISETKAEVRVKKKEAQVLSQPLLLSLYFIQTLSKKKKSNYSTNIILQTRKKEKNI